MLSSVERLVVVIGAKAEAEAAKAMVARASFILTFYMSASGLWFD